MKETQGNIWDFHRQGHWIVITTNGTTRNDGACVMGRGIAEQAALKFPDLPYRLGDWIHCAGNRVGFFPDYNIITLPVKHNWWDKKADLHLIEKSIQTLRPGLLQPLGVKLEKIYMVRPGCGNGRLDWKTQVKPILEKYLDDRFIAVERKPNE